MVSARRVGGSGKWSEQFMALGGDTTNAAAGFRPGAVLGRGGAARVCGADRRHVSCSCDSVAGLCRSYLFDFGDVSAEERASDDGEIKTKPLNQSDDNVSLRKLAKLKRRVGN